MSKFELDHSATTVTTTRERVRRHGGGVTMSLPEELVGAEWEECGGRSLYTFSDIRTYDEVVQTVAELLRRKKLAEAIRHVAAASIKSYSELSPPQKWSYMAVQLPGDWGPRDPIDREHIKETITSKVRGVVLEAMCGFTSYVGDNPNIQEVLAMDFCIEALELYERPERTRILFDLNNITKEQGIEFLPDQSIDTVCITFGVNYLSDPFLVYKEFLRILSEGGRVIIIGGKNCGYDELVEQPFDPIVHAQLLCDAGFDVNFEALPYWELRPEPSYYLIEAIKGKV